MATASVGYLTKLPAPAGGRRLCNGPRWCGTTVSLGSLVPAGSSSRHPGRASEKLIDSSFPSSREASSWDPALLR